VDLDCGHLISSSEAAGDDPPVHHSVTIRWPPVIGLPMRRVGD
jgi:hypothetical protein